MSAALIVTLLLSVPACIGVLWVLYMAVMNLKAARDAGKLPPVAMRMGQVVLAVGLFWDFFCNMLPVSILFLDLPREWLVTGRIQRHVDHGQGWRHGLAVWFAVNMLNPFDPSGQHITFNQNDNSHAN